MYIFVFFVVARGMKNFRKSGGLTGLDPSEGLFEEKIFACCVCCCHAAANTAGKHMDKADEAHAEKVAKVKADKEA